MGPFNLAVREIQLALSSAKYGKSPGFEMVPVEVIRNTEAITFLYKLHYRCFESGVIPDIWTKDIYEIRI